MNIITLVKTGIEFIRDAGLERAKQINREKQEQKVRDKQVKEMIERIIASEIDNPYYEALVKTIQSSTIINDAISSFQVSTSWKFDFDSRLDQSMTRLGLTEIERNYVRGVMRRVYIGIRQVLQEPGDSVERRIQHGIEAAKDEVITHHDKRIDVIERILEEKRRDLSDEEYNAFEMSIINMYLQGNIQQIQDVLLKMARWQQKGQADLPNKVDGIFGFMKVATGCYLRGILDFSLIDDCLSCTFSRRIKELIIALVLVHGVQVGSEKLLEKYSETYLAEYVTFLSEMQRDCITMEEVVTQENYKNLWAVSSLFNISSLDWACQYSDFFRNAEGMLPNPVIKARLVVLKEADYAVRYAFSPKTEKIIRMQDELLREYAQYHAFFDECGEKIKERYYIDFARQLLVVDEDVADEWYEVVLEGMGNEGYRIAIQGQRWRSDGNLMSVEEFEDCFNRVQNSKDKSIPINLVYAAYFVLGNDYMRSFLKKRMYLLEDNIHYLRIALEVGMDANVMDECATTYQDMPEYYMLKEMYSSQMEGDEEADGSNGLIKSAIAKYLENESLSIFSFVVRMIEVSVTTGDFPALSDKLYLTENYQVKRLLAQTYLSRVNDRRNAYRCIMEVINSDAVRGSDYALLGHTFDADEEAMKAYEKGYELDENEDCLYGLLGLQYKHNMIDVATLKHAEQVLNDEMQHLVACCYSRRGEQNKEKVHATKALLLCANYKKEIYGHFLFTELRRPGRESIEYVREDTYVVLEDCNGVLKRYCFYAERDMLPKDGVIFGDSAHYVADLSANARYSRLYMHKPGDCVEFDDGVYSIKELGDYGGHLFRICLAGLEDNGDITEFRGEVGQTIEQLTAYLVKDQEDAERMLEEYKDLKSKPILTYTMLNKYFSGSYVMLLNSLAANGPMLRSMHNHEIVDSSTFVVGIDTIYLLSRLELSATACQRICNRLVLAESAFRSYQQAKKADYQRYEKSEGFMRIYEGKPRLIQIDPREAVLELNELYGKLEGIVTRIPRQTALFACPSELKHIEDKLADIFGQGVLDGLQMATEDNAVIIDDAAVACFFATVYPGRKWGTIMNLLAHSDLSIHEMLYCLRILARNKYLSVFVYDYFVELVNKFERLYETKDLDVYEEELAEFIDVMAELLDHPAEYGNFIQLMQKLIAEGRTGDIIHHMTLQWARVLYLSREKELWRMGSEGVMASERADE